MAVLALETKKMITFSLVLTFVLAIFASLIALILSAVLDVVAPFQGDFFFLFRELYYHHGCELNHLYKLMVLVVILGDISAGWEGWLCDEFGTNGEDDVKKFSSLSITSKKVTKSL